MREIEGIDKVIESLKPHRATIEAQFNRENERFKVLMNQDHDVLGQVLKCHLVVEHYLDRYLTIKYSASDIRQARLTFFQKAKLLPDKGTAASFVKPGIVKLNEIRNKFGHNLEMSLDHYELDSINQVFNVAYQETNFSNAIDLSLLSRPLLVLGLLCHLRNLSKYF